MSAIAIHAVLSALFWAVVAGHMNWVSPSLGAGTLVVVMVLKRTRYIPGALTAVVGTTIVVAVFDLAAPAGVVVLGRLPQGLPAIAFPLVTSRDFVPLVLGGIAVALVSFADTSVLSRAYTARSAADVRVHFINRAQRVA